MANDLLYDIKLLVVIVYQLYLMELSEIPGMIHIGKNFCLNNNNEDLNYYPQLHPDEKIHELGHIYPNR